MDIDCLRYFAAAAKEEHFGKAAQALSISQSALSRGIARLEEYYGLALFQRDGRGVRVTRSGRALLRRVERIIAEIDDARRELGDVSPQRRNRSIAFGFDATLGLRVVPDAIRRFREQRPDVDFRLFQGSHQTLQRLVDGEIDLCVSSLQFTDPALEWQPLWDEELLLLVPATHPVAVLAEADLSAFADDSFVVLKSNDGLSQAVESLCGAAGFDPRISIESDAAVTLHGLVAAGFGVAFVPKLYAAPDSAVTAVRIRSPRCSCTFGLLWPRTRYFSQETVEFRDFLLKLLRRGGR